MFCPEINFLMRENLHQLLLKFFQYLLRRKWLFAAYQMSEQKPINEKEVKIY